MLFQVTTRIEVGRTIIMTDPQKKTWTKEEEEELLKELVRET